MTPETQRDIEETQQALADALERCRLLDQKVGELTWQLENRDSALAKADKLIRKLQSEKPPLTEKDWHDMVKGDTY